MMNEFAIGVDIGGTKIAFALVSQDGKVHITPQELPVAGLSYPQILDAIALVVNEMAAHTTGTLLGIGIGTPGQVIPDTGMIYSAVNLGWDQVNILADLKTRLNCSVPLYVRKDADASIIGEMTFGAARGYQDVVYLSIGSGLGGAFVANGRLVCGANGTAAYVGHIPLVDGGRLCACGLHGCAETVVSGPGLVFEARRLIKEKNYSTCLSEVSDLTPAGIVEAARQADELARQAVSNLASGFGKVLALCLGMMNPQIVVIGGGLALAAFDIIIPEAVSVSHQYILPSNYQSLELVPSGLVSSAVGAASLVWYEMGRANEH